MKRDPFARAAKRLVKRLGCGHTIKILAPESEWQVIEGVFFDPLLDVEISAGGKSGQDVQLRQTHIVTETVNCEGCEDSSQDWSVMINQRQYYVTKAYSKEDGLSYLFLCDEPDSIKESPAGAGIGRDWS